MKKVAILLSLVVFFTVSCEKREQESQVSDVSFTLCKQAELRSSREDSITVVVEFTNKGVQITHYNFEVPCDFNTVNVTHTLANGVLKITQQGCPNQANCVCHSDVSYTIEGISQNEVNVIFINDKQVYCHNDNDDSDCNIEEGTYFGAVTSETPSLRTMKLELKDGKFTGVGTLNNQASEYGTAGTFSINGCKITFKDEIVRPVMELWYSLNGDYDYTFDGKSLKFSNGINEYDLVKVGDSISNCDPNVKIDAEEYFNIPEFRGNISNIKIEGNNLKFTITASGCSGNSWIAKLITTGAIEKSLPPQRTLQLSFENKEMCTAVVSREFSFNIACLQVEGYNKVQLNISGKSILYQY